MGGFHPQGGKFHSINKVV